MIWWEPGGSGGGINGEQTGIIGDGAGMDLIVAQKFDRRARRGPARDDAFAVGLDPHDIEGWARQSAAGGSSACRCGIGAAGLAGCRQRPAPRACGELPRRRRLTGRRAEQPVAAPSRVGLSEVCRGE